MELACQKQKYFNPAACIAPSKVRNYLLKYVFFHFNFKFTFMLLEYIGATILLYPVYKVVLGPAAASLVVWVFPGGSLKTQGWPWVDIIHPSGVVVSLTYSPYREVILTERGRNWLGQRSHAFCTIMDSEGGQKPHPTTTHPFNSPLYKFCVKFEQNGVTIAWNPFFSTFLDMPINFSIINQQ